MELDQIRSFFDFRDYLKEQVEPAEIYEGSLEDYLRAVLRSVIEHEHDTYTWKLQARILTDGLSLTPLPFDQAWLQYTGPGEIVRANSEKDLANVYEAALSLLKYQIADLHRMEEAGTINNPYRYFGIESPTGHTWYNFTPGGFLGCALSCMEGGTEDSEECSWYDLGVLLWLGQIYE